MPETHPSQRSVAFSFRNSSKTSKIYIYFFSNFLKRKITNKRTLLFHLRFKFDLDRNKCFETSKTLYKLFIYVFENIRKIVDRSYYTIVYFHSEYFIFTIIDNSCSLFEHQQSHIPMFTASFT